MTTGMIEDLTSLDKSCNLSEELLSQNIILGPGSFLCYVEQFLTCICQMANEQKKLSPWI